MRPRLPALEKNVLKYRALQMLLLLHQVESFRVFLIGSIRATDSLPTRNGKPRLPAGAKRPLETALAILVQEGVISQGEKEDLHKIIDVRNKIGHAVHDLLSDVSAPELRTRGDARYDYSALTRFEKYRKKVEKGMSQRFLLQLSFREVKFEQAEATYKEELSRLRKRIDRQLEARRATAA